MPHPEPHTALEVKIVWTQGCRYTMKAIDRIEDAAEEMGIAINLETVLVTNLEDAREYRFQGSPTILVNGQDIDPAYRQTHDYGFRSKGHGAKAMPSVEMIRAALLEAQT